MERQEATNLSDIRPDHKIRYKLASEIIKKKSLNKLVVDAGCGIGYGSYILADFVEEIIGIEINADAIKKATKYYNKKNIRFINSDIFKFQFTNSDLIVCFEFLEHIKEDEKLIKLFSEFSKNLLISTPNELIRPHLKPRINPFHFRHYTPEQLERLLNKYGYYIQNWYSQKSGSNFKLNNGTDGKFIIAYCEKK